MGKFFLTIAISLMLSINLKAYEDLGVYGEMYEIKEKDFRQLLKEKWEKTDKEEIKSKLQKSVFDSLTITSSIPTCSSSQQREFNPTIELKADLIMPYTDNVIKEKGTYNILKELNINFPYSVIFINADDELQVELAQFYKEQLGNKIQVMLVQGDFLKFTQNTIFKDSMVARQNVEAKAFNLQCVPSIYTQQNEFFMIQEYNPMELLKNEKN
jgi:hypothetical protein